MKFINYTKITALLLGSILLFGACEDTLKVDSQRVDFPGNQSQNNIYTMIGVFSKMENLAVPYVLMGELRADLLETTEDADKHLKEIYNNEVSEDNPYNVKMDYYSVINQCNYIINNIDTSIVEGGENIYKREYVAAKGFRAWTYMQLALNYGEATYIEKPMLDVKDADEDFPTYKFEELASVLINDLLPWVNIPSPKPIDLGEDVTSDMLYFGIRSLLGDLYLWTGQYEQAARAYYTYIYDNVIIMPRGRKYRELDGSGKAFNMSTYNSWNAMFDLSSSSLITCIANSLEYGKEDEINNLFLRDQVLYPTSLAIENWDSQKYYGTETLTETGDLRGDGASYYSVDYLNDNHLLSPIDIVNSKGYIRKFIYIQSETSTAIIINRKTLLYLRYAEALNRTERPNAALAILKYGLDKEFYEVDTIVPRSEMYIDPADSLSDVVPFIDFTQFPSAIGIHDHGCGESKYNKDLVIPALATMKDSMEFVEDLIVKELALETAFEGNRFHDLMRVAKRRNDNSYLAKRIGAKYNDGGVKEAALMIEENWYLP